MNYSDRYKTKEKGNRTKVLKVHFNYTQKTNNQIQNGQTEDDCCKFTEKMND